MSDLSGATAPANGVRWTGSKLRKAFLNPKPRRQAPKNSRQLAILLGEEMADDRPMTRMERRALEHLAARADIVTAAGRDWLIVPATPALVDSLATIGAATEDLEGDVDAEDTHDSDWFTVTEWSPETPYHQFANREDDWEATKPEGLDQSIVTPSDGDDFEDEFEQRLHEHTRLSDLIPGFEMAAELKYSHAWRSTQRQGASATKAAANAVRRAVGAK